MKKTLIILSMISLLATNTLTLLNQSFHQMGFEFLKSAIDLITPESIAKELISNSPTQALFRKKASIQRVGPRIYNRAIKNALKNVGDLPLEVVPIVGAAAIVALTISDIYDDCQTLKDLNEINIAFELETQDEKKVCGIDTRIFDRLK
jgi:hypothetical protein